MLTILQPLEFDKHKFTILWY